MPGESPQKVRLVSTGHSQGGQGAVVADEWVGPKAGLAADGWQAYILWGADSIPVFPDDGTNARYEKSTPPPGAVRLVQLVIYPNDTVDMPSDERELDGIQKAPKGAPGMHFTATVDLIVVLDGEVTLELDSEKTVLKAGDFLVQNGTRHAWKNYGTVPARLGVVVIGTEHQGF